MQMRAGMRTYEQHLQQAEADARALLEEAPDAPYGHALLGFIAYERGDLPGAVGGLTQALKRDASDGDARLFRGIALEAAGQSEAAVAAGREFCELDPLSAMAAILLGSAYWFVGRPADGLEWMQRGLTLDPENPIVRWTHGYTHALVGNRGPAREQADWMQQNVPQMPYTVHLVALTHAMEGRPDQALSALRAISVMTFDAHITFHLSEAYAMAGDHPTALEVLGSAVERGFYPVDFIASYCPFLKPLRGSDEFKRIVTRAAQRAADFRA
jgi:tetratricopeptide (TPR) repeat protein